jgi:hypothetical protein
MRLQDSSHRKGDECTIDAEEIFRCYFLVRDLGMTVTAVAERLGIGQPAVGIAVFRKKAIVRERGLTLPEGTKVIL